MTANNHFLEIPIYRCSRDAHETAMDRKREAYCASSSNAPAQHREMVQWHFAEHKWTCWEYNDAIGWLRVFWLDWQLRGEYHLAGEKRLVLGGRRTFEWCGKAFEQYVPEAATSRDIFNLLLESIAEFSREFPLNGRRHIDTRALERIGPHVDWRAFIEFESKRPNREKLGY